MKEQKQQQILAQKFLEAAGEAYPVVKSMFGLIVVNGFERGDNGDYIFLFDVLPGKESELAALESAGNNFTERGHFSIDKNYDFSTWTNFVDVKTGLIFKDGLLRGFKIVPTQYWPPDAGKGKMAWDIALKSIRSKSIIRWNKDEFANAPKPKYSKKRQAFFEDFSKRLQAAQGKLPLLTLKEFFDGNTDEESLAPNQWGAGRPKLKAIWAKLREIEERQDVAWVRVQLHADTFVEESDEGLLCEIAGDAIAICTSAAAEDIERAIDTESLHSDGVIAGWVLPPEDNFSDILAVPDGFHVFSVVWD
ncbi:MAG: hypothetical protein FWG66_03605 [Spirochaetes bacterium]|nr:hypothetical protein [Spirochaetota bacterium]